MGEKLPNQLDHDRKGVSTSNPLYKLPEFSEYSKVAHYKGPSFLAPNQKSPKIKKLRKISSPGKKLTPSSTNLAEVMHDSFHMKFPTNLVSIDYVIKSLKHHRKTHSINDLNHLSMSTPISKSGDISRCTSERWIFDSMEKPVATRKLPNNRLNFGKLSMESGSKSSGIIRTKWKDGLPYFEFYLRGKGGEYFVANPLKVNNLEKRGLDYIYLFHKGVSRKSGSNFVGMMEVSSSLILNSGSCCNYLDTEFALFSTNTRGCDFSCTKNRGLKKALEILRPNNPFSKSKSTKGSNFGESSVVDESAFIGSLSQQFPSDFESCAIVVRNRYENKKEPISGGWGLNFLQKAEYGEISGQNCEENGRKFGVEISVLLPSGVHASPDAGNGVPSRLIERWRSGGLCDCGGWDLGCPITVLKNSNSIGNKEDLLQVDENGSINLYIEGTKRGNPMIRLSPEKEGLNVVYFNTTLSALQCFSAGIAILHQQISDLC